MSVKFLGKKLLFIVAHPDDESFSASGTMVKNHKLGGKNFIVCATYGEKGKSHMRRAVTEKQLKLIRKRELLKASRLMGAETIFLGFPDTAVDKKMRQLAQVLPKIIAKIQPDYIFSFGPGGSSGHLDHIAIGQASKAAARLARIPYVAFATSPAFAKRRKFLKNRRRHGKYSKVIRNTKPNVKIKVDQKIKLKILQSHKSQMGGTTLGDVPKNVVKNIFSYEYFRVY